MIDFYFETRVTLDKIFSPLIACVFQLALRFLLSTILTKTSHIQEEVTNPKLDTPILENMKEEVQLNNRWYSLL